MPARALSCCQYLRVCAMKPRSWGIPDSKSLSQVFISVVSQARAWPRSLAFSESSSGGSSCPCPAAVGTPNQSSALGSRGWPSFLEHRLCQAVGLMEYETNRTEPSQSRQPNLPTCAEPKTQPQPQLFPVSDHCIPSGIGTTTY